MQENSLSNEILWINKLSPIREAVHNCTRCPLYMNFPPTFFPVCGNGGYAAKILVIKSSINREASLLQESFSQQEKVILRKLIKKSGLTLQDFYISSAIKCFSETINKSHIEACKIHLWNEMVQVAPKVIVTLGKTVSSLLLKSQLESDFTIEKIVGDVYTVDYIEAKIVSLYCLEQTVNGGKERVEFSEDVFCRIKELLKG